MSRCIPFLLATLALAPTPTLAEPSTAPVPLVLAAGWDGKESLSDIVARRKEEFMREKAEREAAEKQRQQDEARAARREAERERELEQAVAGAQLRGMSCYAEPTVALAAVPDMPPTGCANVSYRVTCPGNTEWTAEGSLRVTGDARDGCQGPTARVPSPPCDPALMEVAVGVASACP